MAASGDPLKTVRPGEDFDFPAQTYNLLMALLSNDNRGQGAIFEGAIAQGFGTSIIQVKNGTAGNLPRFSVLGLNGTIIDPTSDHLEGFAERVVLSGRTPSLPGDIGKWAIILQPLASNEIGYAVVNGACPVQIDVIDAGDGFAEANDGDSTKLKSGSAGAPILYKESGTGVKWAVVRVGNNGGGVDVMNNDTTIVAKTPFINLKGNGTQNVLQFATDTVSSVSGSKLQFITTSADYKVLQQVGGVVLFDWVRAH